MPDAEPSIAAERRIISVLEVTVLARRPRDRGRYPIKSNRFSTQTNAPTISDRTTIAPNQIGCRAHSIRMHCDFRFRNSSRNDAEFQRNCPGCVSTSSSRACRINSAVHDNHMYSDASHVGCWDCLDRLLVQTSEAAYHRHRHQSIDH